MGRNQFLSASPPISRIPIQGGVQIQVGSLRLETPVGFYVFVSGRQINRSLETQLWRFLLIVDFRNDQEEADIQIVYF